jgi:hypothetical protein
VLALEMFIISAKTSVQKEEKTELYLHIYIYIYIYLCICWHHSGTCFNI